MPESSRVKSTTAMIRNKIPASALPRACFDTAQTILASRRVPISPIPPKLVDLYRLRNGRGSLLRLHGRRLDAEDARGPGREPPVPAAEEGDDRGCQDAADDRRVDQDASPERRREDLRLRARLKCEGDEGEEEDQRRARDEAPGTADPLDDGTFGRAAAVVRLPHPADDEDLVVHRDAEEEGEGDHRQLDVDRLRRLDTPDRFGAESLLVDEHDQPPGGADGEQVQEDSLQRQEQRAERPRQQEERQDRDEGDYPREVAVDSVEEVGALRRLATDRH